MVFSSILFLFYFMPAAFLLYYLGAASGEECNAAGSEPDFLRMGRDSLSSHHVRFNPCRLCGLQHDRTQRLTPGKAPLLAACFGCL